MINSSLVVSGQRQSNPLRAIQAGLETGQQYAANAINLRQADMAMKQQTIQQIARGIRNSPDKEQAWKVGYGALQANGASMEGIPTEWNEEAEFLTEVFSMDPDEQEAYFRFVSDGDGNVFRGNQQTGDFDQVHVGNLRKDPIKVGRNDRLVNEDGSVILDAAPSDSGDSSTGRWTVSDGKAVWLPADGSTPSIGLDFSDEAIESAKPIVLGKGSRLVDADGNILVDAADPEAFEYKVIEGKLVQVDKENGSAKVLGDYNAPAEAGKRFEYRTINNKLIQIDNDSGDVTVAGDYSDPEVAKPIVLSKGAQLVSPSGEVLVNAAEPDKFDYKTINDQLIQINKENGDTKVLGDYRDEETREGPKATGDYANYLAARESGDLSKPDQSFTEYLAETRAAGRPADGPTGTYKQFLDAKEAGDLPADMGFAEFVRTGTPNTVGNYDKAQLAEKTSNMLVGRATAIWENGDDAERRFNALTEARRFFTDPNLYVGAGADIINNAKKVAQAVGVDVKGVASAEAILSLSAEQALAALASLKGTASDADMKMVIQTTTKINDSWLGSMAKIQIAERASQFLIGKRDQMINHMAEGGELNAKFFAQLNEQSKIFQREVLRSVAWAAASELKMNNPDWSDSEILREMERMGISLPPSPERN